MSTYDLYADGFPHSTPAGHEQGCRGAACPGKLDNGYSCSEAAIRYNGDFTYRRLVDSGKTPQEITALAAEIAKPKREIVSKPERTVEATPRPKAPSKPLTAQPVFEATKADEVAPIVTYTAEGKPVTHGTPNGYQKGCRNEDLCPNVTIGLISCVQARRDYARARNERIRAEQEARRAERIASAPRPPEPELKLALRETGASRTITTDGEVVVTVKTLQDGSTEVRIQVPAGPAPRIVS